jgi:tungstate transport system ATP-binding protein
MSELLALENATIAAGGKTLLSAISLTIDAGAFVCVLGANGAGKSTLLRVAHRLLPLASGVHRSVPASQQAMLFQRPPLLKRSAQDNVRFVLAARGVPATERAQRTNEALAACGLAAFANRYARSLSGGEQQRLALACAWALRPRLLFADEPTASLDLNAVHAVEAVLRALHAQGTAIVMTTHHLAQAKRLAQRIFFLDQGRLTDDAPAELFFTGTQSASAQRFFEGERL